MWKNFQLIFLIHTLDHSVPVNTRLHILTSKHLIFGQVFRIAWSPGSVTDPHPATFKQDKFNPGTLQNNQFRL